MAIPAYTRETYIHEHDWLKVTRPDNTVVYVRIVSTNHTGGGTANNPNHTAINLHSDTFTVDLVNTYNNTKHELDWHNCYSFGNGVESNRVGDTFNSIKLTPGVRVSTVFEDYKEEHRKYGMIYSGIYNSNSGVNNLNQFIQAQKITKDINPTHGSIQKLHARDTDLIALCEDKVLRIMANKDALYNADGKPQLIATQNVLGQAVPFVGEYGISKNPESFVAEAYRSYFTDKQRGAVMRLSRDGLTPISQHGMINWFRENLSTSRTNLLGEDNFRSGDRDSWLFTGFAEHNNSNVYMSKGVCTFGIENERAYDSGDYSHDAFGQLAQIVKPGILEKGKKYRLTFTVLEHSGPPREHDSLPADIYINKGHGSGWSGVRNFASQHVGTVSYEWISESVDLCIGQARVNQTSFFYDADPTTGQFDASGNPVTSVQEYIGALRGETSPNFTGSAREHFWAGVCKITNMFLEEVKESETQKSLIGSYDDKLGEYNLTLHGGTPKTLTFREDVKGWVSFKSFIPESGLSCANDYYTIKNGKLWQHHVPGAGRNVFYGGDLVNSTIDVLLNDIPSSVKNFYTLDYTGSRSKILGAKRVQVVDNVYHLGSSGYPDGRFFYIGLDDLETLIDITLPNRRPSAMPGSWIGDHHIRQYRWVNGQLLLIKEGPIQLWRIGIDNPENIADPTGTLTRIHGRWLDLSPWYLHPRGGDGAGDWEIGDIITTELQERSVDHFYATPRRGWFVSDVTTDLEEGRLTEFIKKEGKYFNYLKGDNFKTADFDEDGFAETFADNNDWATKSIQGIGIIKAIETITEIPSWGGSPQGVSRRRLYFGDAEFNGSLVVGRRVWCENPTKQLGPELVDIVGLGSLSNTSIERSKFTFGESVEDGLWPTTGLFKYGANWNGLHNPTSGPTLPNFGEDFFGPITPTLEEGSFYRLTFSITDFVYDNTIWDPSANNLNGGYVPRAGTSAVKGPDIGFKNIAIVDQNVTDHVVDFVAPPNFKVHLMGHSMVDAKFRDVSVRKLEAGGGFGAPILQSRNITEIGRIIDIGELEHSETHPSSKYGKYITLHQDTAGLPGEYVMFTNNPIVNSSSLKGYYAKVRLENDSRGAVELFELGSEISESSK
jgi:hypothetical protein